MSREALQAALATAIEQQEECKMYGYLGGVAYYDTYVRWYRHKLQQVERRGQYG